MRPEAKPSGRGADERDLEPARFMGSESLIAT